MADWYVIASLQKGSLMELRIVGGPLDFEQAQEEARERARRAPEGTMIAVVEFDPNFALSSHQR